MVNQQKELPRRLARQNGDYYLVSVTAKTLKISGGTQKTPSPHAAKPGFLAKHSLQFAVKNGKIIMMRSKVPRKKRRTQAQLQERTAILTFRLKS